MKIEHTSHLSTTRIVQDTEMDPISQYNSDVEWRVEGDTERQSPSVAASVRISLLNERDIIVRPYTVFDSETARASISSSKLLVELDNGWPEPRDDHTAPKHYQ